MAKLTTNVYAIFLATIVLFVGICGIGPNRLAAQGTTATILGIVTDSSHGAIAEAAITVKNVGTGITVSATTDAQGRYTVPDLEIGDYEVQVSKAGFTAMIRKGVTLTVGSNSVVDFALSVGSQTQTVTVEAQVVQVETTNSSISALIDPKQMRDLPLNGRSFEQLIQLSPGVNAVTPASVNARQGNAVAESYAGAGARAEGAAILLDDEDINSWYKRGVSTITGSSLGIEAMAEFQVLTNTYGAQFGGNALVVNAVSRAGTNSLHGSVYEFLRNSALDARNFFDGPTIPSFRRNQFGGSLGGPIKKDKLFFFANYEGLRLSLGETVVATVPDATHRTPAASVTDPTSYKAIVDTLALYPLPVFNLNRTLGTGQLNEVSSQRGSESYALMRLDYQISSKDSIFSRYVLDRQSVTNPFTSSPIPLWPEEDVGKSDFFTTEWKRIISNNIINTARFSLTRPAGVTSEEAPGAPATPALQFFPADSGRTVGTVSISGLSGLGLVTFVPSHQYQTRFLGGEDLLWTHGTHSLRFGASVARLQSNIYYPFRNGATWSFTSLTNFLAANANVINGVPLGPQFSGYRQYREIDFAFYVQDDWKATSKLTLNLGVRYEPQTNPVDAHNALFAITNFVTGTGFTNVPHITQTNPNWKNIDPRVGFAYDLFADHKTALRGGFALDHVPFFPGNYTSAFATSAPWNNFQQFNVTYPFLTSLAASTALPTLSPGWDWFNAVDPYMIEYNLNIQRQLLGAVVSVGYIGSAGVHLESSEELNPPVAPIDANGVYHFGSLQTVGGKLTLVSNPRIDPNLGSIPSGVTGTNSRYNSLQATVNRRFSGIVQAQVAYTYSSCIDNGGLYLGPLNPNGGGTYENPYNPKIDRGLCNTDIKNNLRINAIVALPFKGNRFVQGWQLAGIGTIQSGLPFNPTDGYDVACNSTCGPRPNVIVGCNALTHTVAQWFNPACFPLEAVGTLGNLGRDTLIGPNLRQMDLSMTKDTNINEAYRIQFRVEVFNILNRANFSLPSAALYSAGAVAGTGVVTQSAGQITSTIPSATSRQIQLGLKFIF